MNHYQIIQLHIYQMLHMVIIIQLLTFFQDIPLLQTFLIFIIIIINYSILLIKMKFMVIIILIIHILTFLHNLVNLFLYFPIYLK